MGGASGLNTFGVGSAGVGSGRWRPSKRPEPAAPVPAERGPLVPGWTCKCPSFLRAWGHAIGRKGGSFPLPCPGGP